MYEKLIQDINEYMSSEDINELVAYDLRSLKNTIQQLEKELDNKKFNLVFMGASGAGKTTVISSITGMYYLNEQNNLVQVMPSDEGKRTTPCTVEIIPSDSNKIEVMPKSKDEVEGIINEYSYFITKKGGSVPEEIRTIIKKWIKKSTKEEFKELNDIEEIKKRIANIVGLSDIRQDIFEIKCESTFIQDVDKEKNEIFKELNKILNDIRKGNLETFIIPDKIIIYVNRAYINIPDGVERIVDTRGISSETVRNQNSLVGRQDLEEYIEDKNSIVVYINEFGSVEKPVVDFYIDKLTSYRTSAEDIIKFLVLVNTQNACIESKAQDKDEVEDFIEDKVLEFSNAVELGEDDEALANDDIRAQYKQIKQVVNKCKRELSNFIIYEPLKGLKKEIEHGEAFFIIEDISKEETYRKNFSHEIKGIINARNEILKDRLESQVQVARGYISNQIGISNDTAIGNALNMFKQHIEDKSKNITKEWIVKYFNELVKLSARMDGRTVAAYVRGNGRVISRMETIVDDIYYWHQQIIKELEEKLNILLEEEFNLFTEKTRTFIDYMDDIDTKNAIQVNTRNMIQEFVDYMKKSLSDGLTDNLVGNDVFWNSVYNNYSSTYASALNTVLNKAVTSYNMVSDANQYLIQANVIK